MLNVHEFTARASGHKEGDLLAHLLTWEASARRADSVPELHYRVANDTHTLIEYAQMFVIKRSITGRGWRVVAASSLVSIDRNAAMIRAIEAAIPEETTVQALVAPSVPELAEYPFDHWLWVPGHDRTGNAFCGLLLTHNHPFPVQEHMRAQRITETMAHAWLALTGNRPVRRLPKLSKKHQIFLLVACVVVVLFPVHLSVLAPVEVVASEPVILTAPFNGIVTSIAVAPNEQVMAGQLLVQFDDVKLRNEASLAAEKLQVAQARLNEVSSASFADATVGRGISIAKADLSLAQAEHAYTTDMLARAQLTAPRAGLAVYSDRREWEGRAVQVGQPIMEIADPSRVRYRIDLPAREQIDLTPGSTITLWLDSQPLSSLSATLVDVSFLARETPGGTLAFAIDATPNPGTVPRLGARGIARVRGHLAPLGYVLLRRPITSLRQTIGL
ncbi:HlyD family efflux transporter periplasmic adaptor subunit [Pseudomonas sp. ITA]|uniref:efflux RND transporter periplasmic adaptor subunit n=1 Tax=Pseudomonas sp. ITA TaxID=2825841 RepID=UPI002497FEA3|nr:HlyD family efflux transporter periplasmic adaptor subunit [Pseudomonas sp. ITA]MDI2146170.1 HlyD family efflux transporter periplasmic adaptor subunit [Pseudomonas sp. ITA]